MKHIYSIFSELFEIFKIWILKWKEVKLLSYDAVLFSLVIVWYSFFLFLAKTSAIYFSDYIILFEVFFFVISIFSIVFVYLLTIRTIYKFWKNNSFFLLLIRLSFHILMFITSFAFIFFYINILIPNSFSINSSNFLDYFYFSAVTFTTLWYWDILPVLWEAKVFSIIEIISGYILIILMISNVHNMKDNIRTLKIERTNKEEYLIWFESKTQ